MSDTGHPWPPFVVWRFLADSPNTGEAIFVKSLLPHNLSLIFMPFGTGPNYLAMSDIPAGKHHAFIACLWAHTTSYLVSAGDGLLLIFYIWWWWARAAKRVGRTAQL
jgi:hypothetical protein